MSAVMTEEVCEIGTVAGQIWHYLEEQGPVTMTQLAKELDFPRDAVMQGVGWLAREGKVVFHNGARSKRVGLA
jgi:predicted ArsR family transcriptional regulator